MVTRKIHISHPTGRVIGRIEVPGSKSESNRLEILRALYQPDLEIRGISDSMDTQVLQRALNDPSPTKDVGDAGTAMRFLTAYLATRENQEFVLKGSPRMHERPIGILVEALRDMGADISYLKAVGYPPLRIKGKKLQGGTIALDGSVSSQFISALMMIGPLLEQGLTINTMGLSVSAPYVYLTSTIMQKLGCKVRINSQQINIGPSTGTVLSRFKVEPDWSSASYWFLISLLAQQAEIYLPGFRAPSFQGDAVVKGFFAPLGVASYYIGSGYRLSPTPVELPQKFEVNLVHHPDLAQTLTVALAALHIPARLRGLQTLRIKETDRLLALQTELAKTGAIVELGEDQLILHKGIQKLEGVTFDPWRDHRMAMALAPLALLHPISLVQPEWVTKSYASFWQDLERVGFQVKEV